MTGAPTPSTNSERLSELIYQLLKESAPHLGIRIVRSPRSTRDSAIVVLFHDDDDVIVRFQDLNREGET